MKVTILYYDGNLEANENIKQKAEEFAKLNNSKLNIIDAKDGFNNNETLYKTLISANNTDLVFLTNQIMLLNAKESWEVDHFNIYLYANNNFNLIHNLTEKDLRKAHNIVKLYSCGHFNL